MDLTDLVVVNGSPGVFRLVQNRPNGLVLENMDSGKKGFYSSRKYMFTPLESIAIYTMDDSVELSKVFDEMRAKLETHKLPEQNSKPDDLREYMYRILPDHDEDRVMISDIKKLIKWFSYLNDRISIEKASSEEE